MSGLVLIGAVNLIALCVALGADERIARYLYKYGGDGRRPR